MARQQDLLALGEMLQDVMMDTDVEAIVAVVAETAIASADAVADVNRKSVLLWYGKQLRKMLEGPPMDLAPTPRLHGIAALKQALARLTLRANRMSMSDTLDRADAEWADTLTRALQRICDDLKVG
jgi:hypothetical protein